MFTMIITGVMYYTDSPAVDFDEFDVKNHFVSWLEWSKSSTGESKCIRIYNKVEPKWNVVAECLGLEPGEIDGIKRNNYTDGERVTDVLHHWFDNANNLPNKGKYPKKWSGLIRLIKDSDLGQLADEIQQVLSAPCSNVRGNL